MELAEIYRRDLNLLVALRILLEEGSVSKAAKRLNLSQSAMSRILGRLRLLTGDPLFIRQGQQLIPTQKAQSLNAELTAPLAALQALFIPERFDPANCEQSFKIAATDYAMQTLLPFALPRLYAEAPKVSLELTSLRYEHLLEQLTIENNDLAICRKTGDIGPLQSEKLGLVGVSCLVSKNHPLAKSKLTLADYLTYPHAVIAISDGVKHLLDDALEGLPKPKLVLRAYHLDAAVAMTKSLPLIITVPADLAYLVGEKYGLITKALPFNFRPFDYFLIWHPKTAHSAAQVWFRHLIKEECGKLISRRIKDMGLE